MNMQKNPPCPPGYHGFTLLELMVVVAVAAILLSIAVPSYTNVGAKADRSIAIGDLNEISLAQGRYYSANREYTADFQDLNMAGTSGASITSSDGFYSYTLATQNSNANYTVTASVQNSRDKWDLMLSDKGIKSKKPKGSAASNWSTSWP